MTLFSPSPFGAFSPNSSVELMDRILDKDTLEMDLGFTTSTSAFMDNVTSSSWWNASVDPSSEPRNVTDKAMDYKLPVVKQLLWSMLFAGMVIVAACGNIMVIWIVLAHKRMRTVTNYFIVNLSIADAMVSLLNVPVTFVAMLYNHWPFGLLYCKLSQFVATLSICASVFTLMAICVDRYMAIMNPLRRRMGRRATLATAAAIWMVGCVLSSPILLYQTTVDVEDRVLCYSEWPDGPTTRSHREYAYNVVFMVATYFVPIMLMGYAYLRVGIELWGSQSIGECTQRQLQNIQSKRRVVKMMIVVVTIFVVCWLPFHVYFVVTSVVPEITNEPYVQELYLGIYWLAMSNAMYNPIIYCWMNSRFRRGFQQFFSWCPCVTVTPVSLSRREAVTSRCSMSGSPDQNYRIARNGSALTQLTLGDGHQGRHHLAGDQYYQAPYRNSGNAAHPGNTGQVHPGPQNVPGGRYRQPPSAAS